jgi:hypothetical protein
MSIRRPLEGWSYWGQRERKRMNIGHKYWTIADGWIPPLGDETVAFLNVSPQEAHVQIFICYSNRDPVGPYHVTVPAKRMRRVPFNCLADPELIPRATPYASTITSDVPIVVQRPGLGSEIFCEK